MGRKNGYLNPSSSVQHENWGASSLQVVEKWGASALNCNVMDMVEFSDVLCRYPLGANPRGVKEYGDSISIYFALYFSDYTYVNSIHASITVPYMYAC